MRQLQHSTNTSQITSNNYLQESMINVSQINNDNGEGEEDQQ